MKKIYLLLVLLTADVCFAATAIINSFTTGQVSPFMEARNDFVKYNSACRTIENMFVSAQGPVIRRPGTKFIVEIKDSNYPVRLIPFEYSTDDTYIIEAGNEYMRFYRNGAQILDDSNAVYEIATPFTTGDLNNIRYAQADNIMYIVDGNHPMQTLKRLGHTDWVCGESSISTGPFMPENDSNTTITPSFVMQVDATGQTYWTTDDITGYRKERAFDGISTSNNGWYANATADVNIGIQLSSPVTATRFKMQPCVINSHSDRNPRYCKIEGSADGLTWAKIPVIEWYGRCSVYETNEIEIEQISNYTDWIEVIVNNSISYDYYRFWFYSNWGGAYTGVKEIQIYEGEADHIIASESIFDGNHVGSIWQISQKRENSVMKGTLTADGNSDPTPFFKGGYGFSTSGTSWKGTITLERSTDGNNWEAALTPFPRISVYDAQLSNPAETESEGAYYRVLMEDYDSGTCKWHFVIQDKYNHGIVKITEVIDANYATVTVLIPLEDNNATTRWREGYWSDYRGWPNTVEFHQQRLCLGGSRTFPQTIWFGEQDPDDYLDFSEGTLNTDAFTVALQGQNPIRWLLSQDYLFVGTSGSVGKYGESGEPLTPTSPSYREQTKIGSANFKAVVAGDTQIYIERNEKKVRGFHYVLQYDKYDSPDFTILSENITKSGIRDIAVQSRPDIVLWCVLNDGNMATLTYQREQDVMGWTKQNTDGYYESVARIPGAAEDEVWTVVKRTIDGNDYRYVELFQPRDWGSDQNDCWFVDSGLMYSGAEVNTFGPLNHLEGKTVSVYADGIIYSETVTDSNVIIDSNASKVIVGLPYTTKLETLPIVLNTPSGSTVAENTKIYSVDFDFLNTGYCKYGCGQYSKKIPITFGRDANMTTWQPLYTSEDSFKNVKFPLGSKQKATVYVETDKPLPLCIRALYPEISVNP